MIEEYIDEVGESETSPCECVLSILQGQKFNPYDSNHDRLGSVFDDFGWSIYRNKDGEELKVFAHQHLGLVSSYSHPIMSEADGLKLKGFTHQKIEKDNSVLPRIKIYINEHWSDFFEEIPKPINPQGQKNQSSRRKPRDQRNNRNPRGRTNNITLGDFFPGQ